MDEIETRLKETSENCIKAYESWTGAKKNPEKREKLQEAMHDLRKVAARLEIEIALSEREDMAQRPIPIPPHRSSNRRPGGQGGGLPDFIGGGSEDDNAGNVSENFGNSDRPQQQSRPQGQRSGGGGFQRRPMRRQHGGGGGGGNQGGGEEQPSITELELIAQLPELRDFFNRIRFQEKIGLPFHGEADGQGWFIVCP